MICWRYIVVHFLVTFHPDCLILLQKSTSFQKLHLQISFQLYWFSHYCNLLLFTPEVKWSWKTLTLCERTIFRSISVSHFKSVYIEGNSINKDHDFGCHIFYLFILISFYKLSYNDWCIFVDVYCKYIFSFCL